MRKNVNKALALITAFFWKIGKITRSIIKKYLKSDVSSSSKFNLEVYL